MKITPNNIKQNIQPPFVSFFPETHSPRRPLALHVVVKVLSHVWLFATLWTTARLLRPWDSPGKSTVAFLLLPFPFPGDLPHPGIKPPSPALQADTLLSEPPAPPFARGWVNIKTTFPSLLCSSLWSCDKTLANEAPDTGINAIFRS